MLSFFTNSLEMGFVFIDAWKGQILNIKVGQDDFKVNDNHTVSTVIH